MKGRTRGILASFEHLDATVESIRSLREAGFTRVTSFSPYPDHHLEKALGHGASAVRVFTLVGALTGTATGFALTAWTSMDWPLVTGGKPILSMPAYVVIAFEMTILFGALSTVIGLFINTRLPNRKPLVIYSPDFSEGRYGVYVEFESEHFGRVRELLEAQEPDELREDPEEVAHE